MFGIFKKLFGANNAQLKEAIHEGAFLVDVRSKNEFAGGSVKGAINIPLDTLPAQLAKFKGKKNIVVFCASGMRSSQAKNILQQNGIQNVFNGGAWRNVYDIVNQ